MSAKPENSAEPDLAYFPAGVFQPATVQDSPIQALSKKVVANAVVPLCSPFRRHYAPRVPRETIWNKKVKVSVLVGLRALGQFCFGVRMAVLTLELKHSVHEVAE